MNPFLNNTVNEKNSSLSIVDIMKRINGETKADEHVLTKSSPIFFCLINRSVFYAASEC